MKAVRIHSYGDSDQLHLEDSPQPQAQPGQVVARVFRAGVNPLDWKIRAGYRGMARPDPFPLTLGQDFAGEISASQDAGFRPGERVFGFASGAYAEFVAAAVGDIAPLPAALSYETAAALPTPGVTALQAVQRAANIQPGQFVLIHGGAGAVGSIAVQLALFRGARVAATVLADADAAYLRELGVDPAINSRNQRFEGQVSDLDAVLDLVGGDLEARSFPLLKSGGILVTTVGGQDSSQTEDAARRRGIRTIAFRMQRDAADLAELARMVASGPLRLRVAQVFPIDQARQAQDLAQRGQTHGKVVLRIAA